MCGIAGQWAADEPSRALGDAALRAFRDRLLHRGPDDAGLWRDASAGLALAQRRLAVLDLSPAGRQPMVSASGRFVLVHNGEIYNHLELRARLCSAQTWHGHSDTETVLALIERLGFVATLRELVGMFAIACWDRETHQLWLARDRMGEKPLYWTTALGGYAFASELGALRALPEGPTDIDPQALGLLLRHACVPGERSLLRGVWRLPAAHWLRLRAGRAPEQGCYWDLAEVAARGQTAPISGRPEDWLHAFDSEFERAVRGQLLSDVPIGAFLSGGVDSSAVVAMMQRVSPGRVRSFCIGFDAKEVNEANHARAVARHLGTAHEEWIVGEREALDLVPQLGAMFSEPFADSSQIPTHLVARLARRHVTVALSGDAGDELFAGYNRHRIAAGTWQRLRRYPLTLRKVLAHVLVGASPETWDRFAAPLRALGQLPSHLGDKLHKAAHQLLPASSVGALYRNLSRVEPDPLTLLHSDLRPAVLPDSWPLDDDFGTRFGAAEAMMLADQLGYLPDDILTKVDRCAMALGLETRAPFLDHRLVEFAWRLPPAARDAGASGKALLRHWLYRQVPRALIERPKQGFAVPLASWLRGPLRAWAEDLLEPAKLAPWFDAQAVHQLWRAHLSGRANHHHRLWTVLMVQAWRRTSP